MTEQQKTKITPQAIRAKHKKDLLADWERYSHWHNSGAKPALEPISALISMLRCYAVDDAKKRSQRSERMKFRYPIAVGVYCWQEYSISNLGRVVLLPPKGRKDLAEIGSGAGSTW